MTAAPAAAPEHAEASADAHAFVAAFTEGWRAPRDADAFVAHFRPWLAPDVRLIQPAMPTLVGREAFERDFARPLFALIPDLHAEVEQWAARNDTLYIEITLAGTLAGRAVSWRACDRITLRDGVAAERESYFDPAPLLAAVALHPTLWPRFLRIRLGAALGTLKRRRSP